MQLLCKKNMPDEEKCLRGQTFWLKLKPVHFYLFSEVLWGEGDSGNVLLWRKGLLHQTYFWNIMLYFKLQEQIFVLNIERLIVFPSYSIHQNYYSIEIRSVKCEILIEFGDLFSTQSCLYA